jgi:hypothetical protein
MALTEISVSAINVINTPAIDHAQARAFFATTTGQLLAAKHCAGVSDHVVLSIDPLLGAAGPAATTNTDLGRLP